MLKRMLVAGVVVALGAAILTGCGGKSSTTTTPQLGKGVLYTFVGDSPACDVLSMRASFSGLTMTHENGNDVTVFDPSTTIIKINYASLRDFSSILNLNSIPEGSYLRAKFRISLPQLTVFDALLTPPINVMTTEFTTLDPEATIQPPLTIVKDKINAARVDFDLTRSVLVDAQGQISGKVSPIFKVTPVVFSEAHGWGEFDDLIGFVRTVSPFSSNPKFIGSFTLQLHAGTGLPITVNVTEDTELFGTPSLKELETGRFVELIGFLDQDGNLVAKTVEFQERAVVEAQKAAFLGLVVSTTKDNDGKVTEFELYVREEEPEVSTEVPLDSVVVVKVAATTAFQVSSRPTNFANLPFDATSIAPGQELIVHGKYTPVADQPTTVDASSIYLKLQTMQGNFSSLEQVAADGKTGAFWFAPCAGISQGAPILVFTQSETVFLNVFGLSELSPLKSLLVRGLPFFQAPAGTINGVPVPAGTMVMTARQVHQLQ
jgi:hypothetical protein